MKIYPFEIPKPVVGALIVQVDQELAFFNKLHQHEETQISLIVAGTGKLIIGDSVHTYAQGDVFVIDGKIPHLFQSAPSEQLSHMISLFFTAHIFGEVFFNLPDLSEVSVFFKQPHLGYKLDDAQAQTLITQLPASAKLERITCFLQLLKTIAKSTKTPLTNFINPRALSANEGERLSHVLDYLMTNFTTDITLQAAADVAFMTPNAFCRFFKQHTNNTFFQFLIALRIAHACELLSQNKALSIIEIAEKSGFKSISNFNRKFKAITKMTPTTYIKEQLV